MKKRKPREWIAEVFASPITVRSMPPSPFGGSWEEIGTLYENLSQIRSTKNGRKVLGIRLIRVREVLPKRKRKK